MQIQDVLGSDPSSHIPTKEETSPKPIIALGGRTVQKKDSSTRFSLNLNQNQTEPLEEQLRAICLDTPSSESPTLLKKAKASSDPCVASPKPLRESKRSTWGSPRGSPRGLIALISPRMDRTSSGSPPISKKNSIGSIPTALEMQIECQAHIQQLLIRLGGKDVNGTDLIPKLFDEISCLVAGKPYGDANFVKPLETAAADLWRSCSKLVINVQRGTSLHQVLGRHKDAYETIQSDPQDDNKRFLQLLSQFKESQETEVVIPASVEWKKLDDVSQWMQEQQWSHDDPMARFIRSCSQNRFTDPTASTLFTNAYGDRYGVVPVIPILAQSQSKLLKMTRTFHENGSNTETLEIPIDIFERSSRTFLKRIQWVLQLLYDSNCFLTKISSNAFLQ